jgi:cell wall-associated NlpC family hydrolase
MKHIASITGLVVLVACLGCNDGDVRGDYAPQVGDVLFQSLPHNELTDAIEGASKSPYSHCGIVVKRGEAWLVLEANGPGVREIELDLWILQGRGSGFATYRFKAKYTPQIGSIIAAARKFLGKPYDIHYDLDDAKIYCS